MRKTLTERLEYEGFSSDGVANMQEAVELVRVNNYDIVLLCDESGDLPEALARVPFVVISSQSSVDLALEAARRGALDYIVKPIDMNRLLRVLREFEVGAEDDTEPQHPSVPLQRRRRSSCRALEVEPMIGSSKAMERLRLLIDRVAPSDARVMILGENGTGKELVARWLHCKSHRAVAPFVEVNCAAIPSELIESELFGHEKGAFTSAIKQRKGKFEQANGGTLFMDEIGDMSLSAQAKVLRALQERKICRVGSDKDIDVDVRVVAATNKSIRDEIERGNFREDLYHRIGVIVMKIPPLRERCEDIPLLIDHFLGHVGSELNVNCHGVSREAVEELSSMRWSGNIRELRNVVERLVILCDGEITPEDVHEYVGLVNTI